MPKFNEVQRQWVNDFLRLSSQNEILSFDKLAQVGIDAAAKFGVPVDRLPAGARGVSIGRFFDGRDMMAAPAGGDKAAGATNGSGGASQSSGQSGGGSGGSPPSGGGANGNGGGAAPKQTPYPGHKHTPPGSLPKAKPQPKSNETDEEKKKRIESEEAERLGRRQADRDLQKDPRDPKSVFDESALKKKNYKHIELGPAGGGGAGTHVDEQGRPIGVDETGKVDPSKLHSETELKKAMDQYLDPNDRKGKSLKDLKVAGKIGEPLHKELEAKGFVLQDREGRLKDFNRATGQMEYILRDSTFTTDLEVAKKKGVPQYIYVHEDGGMVRVKPEGTPGNQVRNEPNVSKSVLYKVEFDKHGKVVDTSFENEAFKVDEDGRVTAKQPTVGVKFGPDGKPLPGPDGKPIQKTPAETGGMKKAPRGATEGNAAAKKGVDDVAMEKGHTRAPITPIPGAPQLPPSNRQLGPAGSTSGPPSTSQSTPPASPPPQSPAATFDVNKLQNDTTAFVRKLEETKKAYDDLQTKLDKARLPSESEKLRKQANALEKQFEAIQNEGDALAKQIAAAPEMAGITGATPAETVSKARAKMDKLAVRGKAVGPILLQLQDAFELVESIRYIFQADNAMEGVLRTGKVAAGYAAGAAEFALARYLAGSSAVGFVVVGVLTMKSDQGEPSEAEKRKHRKWQREEAKKVAVGKMLEKIAPGSVIIHKQDDYEWAEPKNTKLFESTLKQVDQVRRENLALEAKKKGIADGLVGASTPQTKFFPKEEDLDDLGITVKDLYAAYQEGVPVGKSQREAAIKRAHALGHKDGKAGKAANFEAVKQWPEMRALTNRDLRKLNNDDFTNGQVIYNDFEESYQQGFDEGLKQAKTQVLTKLEISPNGFSMGGHTIRRLTATGVFSDKSTKDLSGEVTWQSSNEKIVTVHNNEGLVHAYLFNMGGAEVTAIYQGVHGNATGKIKVVVNPPLIAIMPENPRLKVGEKQQFRAFAIDPANDFPSQLDASVIGWVSEDPSRLVIDANGNATVLTAGRPVKVFASHHRSPAQSNTLVTVQ
jgi:hypothetical protein